MAYDTRGMVSVDEMLPSANKVYRTNIGCVMYAGNGVWEGYDDVRVFPTHWKPDIKNLGFGVVQLSGEATNKEITESLSKIFPANYDAATAFKDLIDHSVSVTKHENGESKRIPTGQVFVSGMDNDNPHIPKNNIMYVPNGYVAGIDPSDDVDVYFKSGAKQISDEKLMEEMLEMSKYYSCQIKVEDPLPWDLRIRIDNIRKKSELNVIKYRRR